MKMTTGRDAEPGLARGRWLKRSLVLLALTALVVQAAPGCDSEVTSEPQGCTSSSECPEDQICFGSSACDAVWMCQSEYPCSAAPPFPGCGCDGTVMDFSAGCPARHAYSIDTFAGIALAGAVDWTGFGAPCDPDRQPPFQVKVAISGTGLDEMEGSVFWLRLPGGAIPVWTPVNGLTVTSGAVSFVSSEFNHQPGYSYIAYGLIDKNGDGLCDPAEDIAFAPVPVLDLVDFVVRFDITKASFEGAPASYCEDWL